MYPISHYVNDREEMINQVFSVIKGKKLKSMLPPFLVDLGIDELKALCLEQLLGISKKRVQHVLAGQEMLESSDTDEDSDGEKVSEEDVSREASSVVNKDPEAATSLKKVHKIGIKQADDSKKGAEGSSKKQSEAEDTEGEEGKTLMELLELEMRARAIKALLMKAGKDEGEAETLAIEEALDEKKKKEKEKQKELEKEKEKENEVIKEPSSSDKSKRGNIRKRKIDIEKSQNQVLPVGLKYGIQR